jgi:hypothetical protein
MPFHVRDPWRKQYFEHVPCPDHVHVPIDDIDCHEWFPQYRFVYDKLFVARSQALACGEAGDTPATFPVFAKPRINLKGMGLGSRTIHDAAEFRQHMGDGQMWMTLLQGPHVSTDCAVVQGQVRWLRHATGIPFGDGMFSLWTIHADDRPTLTRSLTAWVARVLPAYTGMINIETIGDGIIEAQIRFADQWCDLYGPGWLEAVVKLYGDGTWNYDDKAQREAYSIPLFAEPDFGLQGAVPPHPSPEALAMIRRLPGVASLQITYHPSKSVAAHPMPPGGFRLAIINAWDLQKGLVAKEALAGCFPGVRVLVGPPGLEPGTRRL